MAYGRVIQNFCEGIFPIQAILGIGGNLVTLMVLLSRPMRSKTNTMLAFAAVSDILFLISMIPNNLSRRQNWVLRRCAENEISPFNGSYCHTDFSKFYVANKSFFTFCLNWFSGSSTWLMVAVSFDRLWAIKSPFSARSSSSVTFRDCAVIPSIFLFNALITVYHNFSFAVRTATQGSRMVAVQNSTLFTILTLINVFFQTIIPVCLMAVFNGFLLFYLRSRRQFLEIAGSGGDSARKSSDETPPLLETRRKITNVSRSGSSGSGRQWTKAERHITITVAAIVSSCVLTHLPSAILVTIIYVYHLDAFLDGRTWYTWIVLSTCIVITGKVANFCLFCMSSRHFRAQMRVKLCWCAYFRYSFFGYKESVTPRTRSLPLNQIADSMSNVPPAHT